MSNLIICVPSYKRPQNFFYEKIVKENPAIADYIVYFVREEEAVAYTQAMPLIKPSNIVSIPTGCVTGVGSTREFIRQYMSGLPLNWYCISDDDVTSIVKARYDANKKSHYDGKDVLETLTFISQTLETLPSNCAIGAPQPRAFAKDFDQPVKVMKTRSPSQIIFYNNRIVKNIPFDLTLFDKHGDDIGYACQIVASGYDYFQIPAVVYSCWDSTFSGLLRTPDNFLSIFDQDYENVKQYIPAECLGRAKKIPFVFLKPKMIHAWRNNEHNN